MRLAALIDRLGEPPFGKWSADDALELREACKRVCIDVNRIKHAYSKPGLKEDFAHPAVGLRTSVDDALAVAAPGGGL